jgi:RNA-directed DNA polymerase
MGLELKASKTSITHTLQPYEGKVGFDFLGFTIRQFPVGKRHSGLDNKRQPLGFTAGTKPSVVAIKRHTRRLDTILRRHRSSPQSVLIDELNPVIRGWSNY